MSKVYLARHEKKGRQVAIKVLPEEFLSDRKRSQYLLKELRIAKDLSHPNVVKILGLHRDNGIGYLIMEYLDGGNLRKHIQRRDLSPANILDVMLKICRGLQYIHNHKLADGRFHSIIHRDIKPENILLSSDGNLKVADFGLSLSKDVWSLRRDKSRAGTPLYMSPEQIAGKPLDIRTDIYSLGNILYELLTGRLPYKHDEKKHYMKQVVSKKAVPPPPSYLDRDVTSHFDAITMRALKKDLSERYQTVAEMMLDLKRLITVLKPDDLMDQFNFMREYKLSGPDAGAGQPPGNGSAQSDSPGSRPKQGKGSDGPAKKSAPSRKISGERAEEEMDKEKMSESRELSENNNHIFPPVWERPGPGKALEMSFTITEYFPNHEQEDGDGENETFADLEAAEIEDIIFIGRKDK